jgi:hypothetical protein
MQSRAMVTEEVAQQLTNPEIASWEQKSSEVFWLTC